MHDMHRACTRSSEVGRQVTTNILNPYADHDIIRISEVFILRQILHSRRVKYSPCVECRRISINIGAIYRAVYGILSRRDRLYNNILHLLEFKRLLFILITNNEYLNKPHSAGRHACPNTSIGFQLVYVYMSRGLLAWGGGGGGGGGVGGILS